MSEAKELQEKIHGFIYEKFASIKEEKDAPYDINEFSWPFFFNISETALKKGLVILGQETNQWSLNGQNFRYLRSKEEEKKEEMTRLCKQKYEEFIGEYVEKYGGNFWRFSKSLYDSGKYALFPNEKMINKEKKELSHCWMNLYFIEKCKHKNDKDGRPSQNDNLAEYVKEKQGNLVKDIIALIKPKVILAVTGPTQDEFLKEQLGINKETSFTAIGQFNKNQLGFITINADTTLIRAYHPNYFMSLINSHKDYDVSKCYREVLRDKLKEFLKIQ